MLFSTMHSEVELNIFANYPKNRLNNTKFLDKMPKNALFCLENFDQL